MDKMLQAIIKWVDKHPTDGQAYLDAVTRIKAMVDVGNPEYHEINKAFREKQLAHNAGAIRTMEDMHAMSEAYKGSLLIDAPVSFDAYMQYIEWEREPARRFWMPRRPFLLPMAQDMEKIRTGQLTRLGISLPPGVGKTTLAIFFLTWLAGLNPQLSVLTFSHSDAIVKGMYGEVLRIVNSEEYLFHDVFPGAQLVSKNGELLQIDLDKAKRFTTFQFSSVGAGNAGRLRASNLLYCDDLVDGLETAMSPERMEKLWDTYATDLRQRMIGDCRELLIGTRWTVRDVIGRLEQNYIDDPGDRKEKYIAIPALDENDESNFDYPEGTVGFSTAFYREQRDTMDEVNWEALFMNHPIERKGQLYNSNELRRYFDLPKDPPDAVYAVCDTKDRGKDYCFMPVCFVYGNDHYCVDCICDNGDPKLVDERLVEMLLKYKVHMAQFESNSAGGKTAEKVETKLKEKGGITSITTRFTTANKETKIIANSPWVKEHVIFRDNSKFRVSSDYGRMMQMLTTYTMMGKNAHDDVPDGWAMYALFVQNMVDFMVEAVRRPF